MYKNYPLLIILLGALLINSCKSGGDLTKVPEAEAKEQYKVAVDLLKRAYPSTRDKKEKADIAVRIADNYMKFGQYSQAIGWYKKGINLKYADPIIYYKLGDAMKMNEEYEDALVQFETYKKEVPADTKVDEQMDVINNYLEWKQNPKTRYIIDPFKNANSSANDFSPMLLPKEGLVFTSDREETTGKRVFPRTGGFYSDLFIAPKIKKGKIERWTTASILEGEVNTDQNEGTAIFDERGSTMYFTRCNPDKPKEEKGAKQYPNCVIMMAKKKGKAWGDAEKLPFCTDTAIDYGHPTLSPDGTKMVFVSDDPNGFGKHDLYLTTYVKRSRTWSDPVNLGEVLNTTGEELFPYFFNDTTLYFSSDGRIGFGGLDIFVTHGQGTTWTKPKHMKYPLNSGGDDFGLCLEEGGESGWFSSNRVKSRGDDIYYFTMTPLVFTLSGDVRDSASRNPIANAKVILTNMKTSQQQEVTVDASGKYMFKLDKETDYEVYSEKRGYFPSKTYLKSTVGLEYSADLIQNLVLTPPTITLHGVYYGLDSFNLRPESVKTLDSVVEVLKTYPYIVVELGSHTDCRASYAYNDTLSQKRSESVVNYLVEHGIEKERLVAKGYGERQLVNNCSCEPNNVGPGASCTEDEHQANRRTTLRVLRWDYVPKKPEE